MKKLEGYYKGVDLGGWISQCFDHYNEDHYNSFITEKDIEKIKTCGYVFDDAEYCGFFSDESLQKMFFDLLADINSELRKYL